MVENQVNENIIENEEIDIENKLYTYDEVMTIVEECKQDNVNDFKFLYNPIEFDENDMNTILESNEYKDGLKESSKLIAMYNSMINSGMDVDTVAKVVLNYQTMTHNIEFQKVVNDGLKYQSSLAKNQSL